MEFKDQCNSDKSIVCLDLELSTSSFEFYHCLIIKI